MEEYIKRQDAYNAILDELVGTGYQSGALRAIEFIPAADVAPKSEVAREIFAEIDILGTYNPELYAEIKKKYIGEQTDDK